MRQERRCSPRSSRSPCPQLRDWADEVAAGVDAGVRLSLRVEADRGRHPVPGRRPGARARRPDAGGRPRRRVERGRGRVRAAGADRRAARGAPRRAGLGAAAAAARAGGAGRAGPGRRRRDRPARRRRWPARRRRHRRALAPGAAPGALGAGRRRARERPGHLRPSAGSRCISTGSSPWAATRSPARRWPSWPRATGRSCGCATSGCSSTRPPGPGRATAPSARSAAVTALGAALTGQVDDRREPGPGRHDGLAGDAAGADRGAARHRSRRRTGSPPTLRDYQLRGLRLAGPDDLARPRRLPRRRHGPRQDDHADRAAPAPAATRRRRAHARGLPGVAARQLGAGDRPVRAGRTGRAATTAPAGSSPDHDGFVLTTYGTMRLDADALAAHRWGLVVADEAQHVKNPASGTAQALRRIPSDARVALTGTPVENNLSELWAILDWTTPGLLGTLAEFRARWADPIAEASRPGARRAVRAAARAVPAAAPQVRPRHRAGAAAQDRDRPARRAHPRAGRAVRGGGARDDGRDRRRATAWPGAGWCSAAHRAQADLQPPRAVPQGARPGARRAGPGKLELLDELLDTILAEDGAVLVFTQYVAMAPAAGAAPAGARRRTSSSCTAARRCRSARRWSSASRPARRRCSCCR